MANLNGFDARQVDPAVEFEPLPTGRYLAVITESAMRPTKSGNGSFLELTFEVIEGECKGRKVWSRLNLDNANPLTVKIARAELSSVCRAIGILQPKDSVELHGVPLVISVKQKPGPDGEVYNEIKGFAKREAAVPAQSQQATSSTPPWKR